MIDIHTHILFDLDDGATGLEESLGMARTAAADGVRVMVATPHSPASTASRHYSPSLIRERVAALNDAIQHADIDLEVVAGTEIAFDGDVVEMLRQGELLPYGQTRTILMEILWNSMPATLETALFALQIAGYRVVLAHPERISEVQQDVMRLVPLVERGVMMQITADALLGGQGRRIQRTTELMLQYHMVHVIASDSHGVAPRRPPVLSTARDRAATLIGADAAAALVTTNPAAIIRGEPLRLPALRV